MKLTVKVSGMREVLAMLKELPYDLRAEAMEPVLERAAEPIKETARRFAVTRPSDAKPIPYNHGHKLRYPGTMRGTIHSNNKLTPRQERLRRREGPDQAEWYVGTRDPIARLVEFGTFRTAAKPFMRPAWDAHKDNALQIIKEQLSVQVAGFISRVGPVKKD